MGGTVLRNVGVLGGSFNPVHLGHLILAQDALEHFELDEILLVPCRNPPHKAAELMAPAEHRKAMLELVAEEDPTFGVSDLELVRNGPSYTIDTIEQLMLFRPEDRIHFIIGSDSVPELRTWHRILELLPLCPFLVVTRPGFARETLECRDLGLPDPWPERLLSNMVEGHRVDISSTDIRMRVAEGMSIRYLVPPCVEMYIIEHGLYTA